MKERKKDNILIFLIIGLLLGIFVKLFVLDILTINGQSMLPSIQDKNTVFVNKLAYGITVPFSSRFFVQWSTPKKMTLLFSYMITK
jgi:signal peptidase I